MYNYCPNVQTIPSPIKNKLQLHIKNLIMEKIIPTATSIDAFFPTLTNNVNLTFNETFSLIIMF